MNHGIATATVDNTFETTDVAFRKVINERLIELGIIKREEEFRKYFPQNTTHYLGLDI